MSSVRVITPTVEPGPEDIVRMLLPEDLARIRSHELRAEADRYRLARQVTAGRWWDWLSEFAARQADRARRG